MDESGCIDLGFLGYTFTWDNNIIEKANIKQILDRVVASKEWLEMFPRVGVQHLTSNWSNHNPIEFRLWRGAQK